MDSVFFQKEKIGLNLPDISNKTIFYCVLNWGVGHATRSVPIIKSLLARNNRIIIFSDGEAENLLRNSFPDLIFHTLPSYKIQYKSKHFLFLNIALQSLTRFWVIRKENKKLRYYDSLYHADMVISDNRYGCYIPAKLNYLITHQLKLVSSNLLERFSQRFVGKLIRPFDELWIPDIASVKLSGDMAEVEFPIRKRWIGFPELKVQNDDLNHKVKVLILLSGPEPRRTELENIYLQAIPKIPFEVTFIAGNFSQVYTERKEGNLTFYSFKKYEETIQYIAAADIVVCRSGYSTLIDLYVLQKNKIVCIPTSGQPEQEYLAKYWSKKGWIQYIKESEIEHKLVDLMIQLG